MNKHRSHIRHLGGRGPAHEGEDGQGVLRDAHVGPLGVMILEHCPFTLGPGLRVPLPTLSTRERREEMLVRLEKNDKHKTQETQEA